MKLHGWAAKLQETDNAAEEDTEGKTLAATEGGIKQYWKNTNLYGLDGLPGLKSAAESLARFHPIDPKTFQYKVFTSSSSKPWMTSQTVAAFTLGAVTSVSVLKLLQMQRFL